MYLALATIYAVLAAGSAVVALHEGWSDWRAGLAVAWTISAAGFAAVAFFWRRQTRLK